MAEITTHIFLAKDIKSRIKCNDSILYFSLGPDAFFFSKSTDKIAYDMHRKKSLEFFKNYIKYIKNNKLEKDEYILGSLYGFISHYVLDYMVHPYIFYKDSLNKNLHRMYEMSLTDYILNEHDIKSNRYSLSNDINSNKNIELIKLLDYVFKETFNYNDCGNKYYKLLNRVKYIYRIFRYDRFGIKKIIYKFIDVFSKNKISLISFYNIKNADLNLNHNNWNHPCDRNEIHNESLIDLYNKSIEISIDIIKSIDLVLNNKKEIEYLDSIIKNYSYVTGKDSSEANRLKYFA